MRRVLACAAAVFLLAACGTDDDPDTGDNAWSTDINEIVAELPESTRYLAVVDVAALLEGDDVAADSLGTATDLADPASDGYQSATALMTHIPPLATPFESAHHTAIDLGRLRAVVHATAEGGSVVALPTAQPAEDLAASYTGAGFTDQGDGVYLHPDTEPAGGSAGWAAVRIEDGRLTLARSTDHLDAMSSGSGPAAPLRTLLAEPDSPIAVAATADPDATADACGAGQAIARDASGTELMLLAGGEDALDRGTFLTEHATIGEPRATDTTTRYPLQPTDPTMNLLAFVSELPSLSAC